MEFCFYCSRFPTPGQAYLSFAERYGQRTFLRALERRLNAALAGGVGARPRRGGLHPRQFAPWSGGLRRACGRGWRASAPGGCTPGNSRPGSWSPVGTVQDRPRRQPRRRLTPRLWERLARVRAGGVAPWAIRALGPGPRWGPFRTDRGGSRDGGSTPRLWERLAHVRAMGFGGRPPPGISPSLH